MTNQTPNEFKPSLPYTTYNDKGEPVMDIKAIKSGKQKAAIKRPYADRGNPSPDNIIHHNQTVEEGFVRKWLRENGWLWHESHVITPECMDDLEAAINRLIVRVRIDEAKRAETFSRNEVFGALPISLNKYFSDRLAELERTNQ